jgi:hypothetical protein
MKKSDLGSFCLVATKNLEAEANYCISNIRKHYDCPIYIACDTSSNHPEAKCIRIADDKTVALYDKSLPQVKRHNGYHSVGAIAIKMDVMARAIRETGNTFLIDSDVIIKGDVTEDIPDYAEAMLSPAYYHLNRAKESDDYGIYNAGYIWSKMPKLPDIWRDIFMYKSGFYEQGGMVWLNEHFDCYHFNRNHNVGFWRCGYVESWSEPTAGRLKKPRTKVSDPVDWGSALSVHCRMHKFDAKSVVQDARFNAFRKIVQNKL